MKMDGSHVLKLPREQVWQLLNDPAVLQRCIPGCEKMELIGEDSYDTVLNVGVGSINGVYNSKVKIEQKQPPISYKMLVEGKGKPGFVKGSGVIQLEEQEGNTTINYQGDVQVGGTIASVGQRMLQGAAKMMVGQFFTAIELEAEALQQAVQAAQQANQEAAEKGEEPPARPFEPPRHNPWKIFFRYILNIVKGWFRGKAK
ncbi:MAG: carbon monoxide dehydrogenase subunit G, partial [Acidobacteriota bacterium]